MSYVFLTPNIVVPQSWPITYHKEFFISACMRLINMDDQKSPVYFEVDGITTRIRRSKIMPQFAFIIINTSIRDDACVVHLLWPKELKSALYQACQSLPKEAVEWTPITLQPDFVISQIMDSGTDRDKYWAVLPDTMKILESMEISNPNDYIVSVCFWKRENRRFDGNTCSPDAGLPAAAAPTTPPGPASRHNVDITVEEILYRFKSFGKVKRAAIMCLILLILFLILH